MKHRSRIEILAEVLAASLKGAKKTHIMNRSNLNFRLVNYYLKVVLSSGLLIFDSANGCYFVTEKGKRFLVILKDYKRCIRESEKKLRIIEDKKDQLQQMCFPVDRCNELTQSDEARAKDRSPNHSNNIPDNRRSNSNKHNNVILTHQQEGTNAWQITKTKSKTQNKQP